MGLSAGGRPRVAMFGGAFDPPHNAHVALAQAALAQLRLAELRIFPTGQAWHKARVLSGGEHRLAMARLAFGELPNTVVDGREVLREGPSYTLDTLRELQAERPDAQLVLVLGADQGRALPQWHGWRDIASIAIISIAHRASPTGAAAEFDPQSLPGLPAAARFERLEFSPVALSATEIRDRARQGLDIASLVPPPVARYIARHHLYTPA